MRSEPRPSITVTTRTHDARATTIQKLAWSASAGAALLALLIVLLDGRGRGRPRGSRSGSAVVPGAVDAFVAGSLIVWWLVGPAHFDDGWTVARERAYATSGGFSNYFEPYGANLPLGYWHDWVLRWITASTDELVLQRVPTVACLAGTWLLIRYAYALIVPTTRGHSASLWTLGVAFVLMAMAWGMSLRQEPAVALLLAAVIVCTARFIKTGSHASLVVAAALVPLALTVHPAGAVVMAPLVAVAPSLLRWCRAFPATAVTLVAASGALTLTLAFLDSDVEQRALDANAINAGLVTGSVGWRAELVRYSAIALSQEPSGVRNASTSGFGRAHRACRACSVRVGATEERSASSNRDLHASDSAARLPRHSDEVAMALWSTPCANRSLGGHVRQLGPQRAGERDIMECPSTRRAGLSHRRDRLVLVATSAMESLRPSHARLDARR